MPANIRKIIVQVEETLQEMGRAVSPPTRRALAMAVIANPYAGKFSENLDLLIDIGEELGGLLGERCVKVACVDERHEVCVAVHQPRQKRAVGVGACDGFCDALHHLSFVFTLYIIPPEILGKSRKAPLRYRRAHVGHQHLVIMQIVLRHQHRAQYFARTDQVMHISAGPCRADGACAKVVN